VEASGRVQVLESGDLLIAAVKEADAGHYTCIRANEAGEVHASAYLTVLGERKAWNLQFMLYYDVASMQVCSTVEFLIRKHISVPCFLCVFFLYFCRWEIVGHVLRCGFSLMWLICVGPVTELWQTQSETWWFSWPWHLFVMLILQTEHSIWLLDMWLDHWLILALSNEVTWIDVTFLLFSSESVNSPAF